MNAHDPEGLRAVAASHLISACNKHELKDISKSQIFDLRQEGFDAFCEASVMIDGEISQISQMMQLLCLPPSCVVGPLTFKEFEDILAGDTTLPPRHTWIIIIKTNALSLDEVVSPAAEGGAAPASASASGVLPDAPSGGPALRVREACVYVPAGSTDSTEGRPCVIATVHTDDIELYYTVEFDDGELRQTIAEQLRSAPVEPVQPYETMFDNFFQAEEAEDELLRGLHPAPVTEHSAATPTALPRTMQPHHFVVAFRRDGDTQLASTLHPGDFRGRGQPSPAVHQLPRGSRGQPSPAVHQLPASAPMHTPGLPSGVTFDSFQPY